ncbi:hypothetical protein POW49_20455, partial [Escherichia coli]
WLQPCLLKIYSHMVTFWGNYEGISQLKAYDDDVLKNLLNGWFMHIAIHAKNLKELADKKGQFIAIYRGFLLSLKDK